MTKLELLSELTPGDGKLCKQSVEKKANYFQVNCYKDRKNYHFAVKRITLNLSREKPD